MNATEQQPLASLIYLLQCPPKGWRRWMAMALTLTLFSIALAVAAEGSVNADKPAAEKLINKLLISFHILSAAYQQKYF